MGNQKNKKPILFTTLGFPGSGKTYFAKRFAKELNAFHLNSDRVRSEIFPIEKHTRKEDKTVFRVMDFIAEELLARGVSVIYDANSTKAIYRRGLRKIARKKDARYLLLYFQTPITTALKRIQRRRNLKSALSKKYYRPISDSLLFAIKNEQETPNNEPFVAIDGKSSYKEQKKIILKSLQYSQ